MQAGKVRLPEDLLPLVCCPVCKRPARLSGCEFQCSDANCRGRFPIIDGVPILINESQSIFSISDFAARGSSNSAPSSLWRRCAAKMLSAVDIGLNVKAKENYSLFAELVLGQSRSPKVLVVGGATVGAGMSSILSDPAIEFVETDVSVNSRTSIVCDAHDIPFLDGSFDGVIVQAVLEHVVDPWRCVQEIHRVLKTDGLVYAETPFMQQVHLGQYDFCRFTYLGHRRLFREFEEVTSGAQGGPGMALAWSFQYFLLSFAKTPKIRSILKMLARCTTFWLKYFDYHLIDQPGTFDAASAFYFLGRKTGTTLSDRDLIHLYRGAMGPVAL